MINILVKQGYLGIFIFILLNIIAMVFYPGGTIIEPSTEGHLFFYNFLSNLGEWTAQNGENNFISAYLFNSSMMILAISYFVFYCGFLSVQLRYNDNKLLNFLSISSIIICLVSFILVAVFSSDDSTFDIHLLFVKAAFRTLLLHCLVQVLILYLNINFSKTILIISTAFSFILFLFILVMEFGPDPFKDNNSLFFQVTSQKIIVISILIYFLFQVKETISIIKK